MLRVILGILLGMFLCGLAAAQPKAGTPNAVSLPEGRFDTQTRPLQSGDQLEIHIFSLPELEKTYLIRADGTFFHPFAGDIAASGKTLKQVEDALRLRFRKELRNPNFKLGLISIAESEAAVLGEVRNQGKFKFAAGTSVLDLLALAGGISEKADRDSGVLLRGGQEVPLRLGPAGNAQLSAMLVRSGDILYVHRGKRVGVSGEVQDKGVYAVSSRSTNSVEDAVKAAGGATSTAALNRVQIIRPSLAKPILIDLLKPEDAAKVVLEDGDTVLVPSRRAILLGAVEKPGELALASSENLMDVVSRAGVRQGRLDSVVVIRASDVVAGNDKKEIYNLESSFREGSMTVNVPISDGDVVFVPNKEESASFLQGGGMLNLIFLARSLLRI